MNDNIFAERLKNLRHNVRKITQEELANQIGVSKTTVSNYETGCSMPDIDILVKIAVYFDVSTDYLLGRTKNLLHEDELPYLRENKIGFFRNFFSPNPCDENQIIEEYISKPYLKEKEDAFLFAYELPYSEGHFDKNDIIYLKLCDE